MRWLRPHPVVWLDRTVRLWWPFLVSIAAIALVATMSYVTWTVVDERKYFEAEAARDQRQDAALAELLEAQQTEDEEAAAQVAEALKRAEELFAAQFARHDLNSAVKLNEMLRRVEALLGRPAGRPLDPVTALPFGSTPPPPAPAPTPAPGTTSPPTRTSRPGGAAAAPATSSPAPAPTPAPTPTTPDQRRCSDQPDHPRC